MKQIIEFFLGGESPTLMHLWINISFPGNLKVDVFEEFEDLEPEPSLEEYISERGEDKKNLTHKIKKDKDWRY